MNRKVFSRRSLDQRKTTNMTPTIMVRINKNITTFIFFLTLNFRKYSYYKLLKNKTFTFKKYIRIDNINNLIY